MPDNPWHPQRNCTREEYPSESPSSPAVPLPVSQSVRHGLSGMAIVLCLSQNWRPHIHLLQLTTRTWPTCNRCWYALYIPVKRVDIPVPEKGAHTS